VALRPGVERGDLALVVQDSADMPPQTDDLRVRILARRSELLAKLAELKADTRSDAAAARDKIRSRLFLLEYMIKNGNRHDWDDLNEVVSAKLDDWLYE